MESSPFITMFQREVAQAFFGLPESRGFLLAGGAALIASGVVERDTDDLDFFAPRRGTDVPATKTAFLDLCEQRGWSNEIAIDSHEFVRMVVAADGEKLAVDFGVDSDPLLPPTTTFLGPTISVEESAGRKTLALFGRWMPRDFVDVYALADRFTKEDLVRLAEDRDLGFDRGFFSQALDQVTTIKPERFAIAGERVPEMTSFFTEWAAELRRATRT